MNKDLNLIQEMADNCAFDTVEGIRAIARYLLSPAVMTVDEILAEDTPPAPVEEAQEAAEEVSEVVPSEEATQSAPRARKGKS